MGLQFVEMPASEPDAGMFNLPPEFDRKQHAAHWVKKGPDVQRMAQRQPVVGAQGVTSDGWQVWKDSKGRQAAVTTSKSGEYILMFRPKLVQDQENALYGNVSKGRMLREKHAAASARQETRADAPGMLTSEQLREARMSDSEADGDDGIKMNAIGEIARATVPTQEVITKAASFNEEPKGD